MMRQQYGSNTAAIRQLVAAQQRFDNQSRNNTPRRGAPTAISARKEHTTATSAATQQRQHDDDERSGAYDTGSVTGMRLGTAKREAKMGNTHKKHMQENEQGQHYAEEQIEQRRQKQMITVAREQTEAEQKQKNAKFSWKVLISSSSDAIIQ